MSDILIERFMNEMNELLEKAKQDKDGDMTINKGKFVVLMHQIENEKMLSDLLGSTLDAVNYDRDRVWERLTKAEKENASLKLRVQNAITIAETAEPTILHHKLKRTLIHALAGADINDFFYKEMMK